MKISYRYNQASMDNCILCNQETRETCFHVLTCSHTGGHSASIMNKVMKYLTKLKLYTHMRTTIMANMRATLDRREPMEPPTTPHHISTLLQIACKNQNLIGWNRFFRGFIASSWQIVHYEYCKIKKYNHEISFGQKHPSSSNTATQCGRQDVIESMSQTIGL